MESVRRCPGVAAPFSSPVTKDGAVASVDQVRVHIVSRSPECSIAVRALALPPALIQIGPPRDGVAAEPSPKLPRG